MVRRYRARLTFSTQVRIGLTGSVIAFLCLASVGSASPGDITTVAGNGMQGATGDNGAATMAELDRPPNVATTPDGGFLIADFGNNTVRKVSASGTITTVAGNGTQGYMGDNGPATSAEMYQPRGVTATPDGGFLIADRRNFVIRKVSASGIIRTVAGGASSVCAAATNAIGDGCPATQATLAFPHALALIPDGGYLIVDTNNHRIRKVSRSGIITTVAGNGTFGYTGDGQPATSAELYFPEAAAALPHGGFLIADTSNDVIRQVSQPGTITTVAGNHVRGFTGDNVAATMTELNYPEGVAPVVGGGFLLSDNDNNRIRKVSRSGIITTVAGNGTAGFMGDNGPATSAELHTPEFVTITPVGGLLIADHDNQRIRAVEAPVVPTIALVSTTRPRSPSNHNQVQVVGTPPAGSFVALFRTARCSGPPLAWGSAAQFAAPGLPITVPDNSVTTLHAVAYAAGGQLSACARSTLRYVEDSIAPNAQIKRHPKHVVTTGKPQKKVKFSFVSTESVSTFRCKLDHAPYHHCKSPKRYGLKPGKHAFHVRAVDAAGNKGPPVSFSVEVVSTP